MAALNKGPLVVLLAILAGVGGWNYHQNSKLENALPRPYRSYSDADIEQLIGQYRGEVGRQTKQYRQVAGRKVVVEDRGFLGDQVHEFERVQQINQRRRNLADQVAGNQISLKQLESEQRTRETDRPIYKMIFRRVTTFQSF